MNCACSDPAQDVWFLAWTSYALTHGHNLFFSNWIYFPSGVNLSVNTAYPLLGVLAAPLTLTLGPVFSYSVLMWLAMTGSATSMMFVLTRWTRSWPASFAGGLLYGFSPYMIGHGAGHLNLTFVPIPPLILLMLDELVVRRERSPRRYGIGLGLLAAAQFFISSEVLVTSLVVSVVGVLVLTVARPRDVRARLRHVSIGLAYALIVCAPLLAYPAWSALEGPQHVVGPPSPVRYISQFRGDLAGAILPTANQLVSPSHFRAMGAALSGNSAENGLYIGLPLLVVLIGFAIRLRRLRLVRFCSVMLLTSYILSLGSRLVVNRHETHAPLPWIVPVHVPILQDAITARFSLYTALFAAVVFGVGLDHLFMSLRPPSPCRAATERRPWGRRSIATAAPLVIGVFALVPLVPSSYAAGRTSVPPLLTASTLQRIPTGSAVLFYPHPSDPSVQGALMLAQADADMRFKMYGGYALRPGPGGAVTSSAAPLPRSAALYLLFSHAFDGSSPLPPQNAVTLHAIRSTISLNNVGTVIVEPVGSQPALVVRYLTSALGRPEHIDGTAIWFDARGRASSRV